MAIPQPKRISQLDLAAPLTIADLIPIDQAGVTRAATVAQIRDALDTACQCTLVSRYDSVCTEASTTRKYLQTYTLPGGTLNTDGSWLEIIACGSMANNTNEKSVAFHFGSSMIDIVQWGYQNVVWEVRVRIQRMSATQQKVVFIFYDSRNVNNYNRIVTTNENLTIDIPIAISGQNFVASAGDICCESFIITINKMDVNS